MYPGRTLSYLSPGKLKSGSMCPGRTLSYLSSGKLKSGSMCPGRTLSYLSPGKLKPGSMCPGRTLTPELTVSRKTKTWIKDLVQRETMIFNPKQLESN